MLDPATLNERGLTEAQEKEVQTVFQYSDDYELTEEDMAEALEMFNTPERFRLLRKILGIHTPNEAGLTFKSPHKLLEAETTDLQKYGLESAISNLADERIRGALVQFYVQLRGHMQGDMTAKFKSSNDETLAEQKRTEEFHEQQEEDARTVGENL